MQKKNQGYNVDFVECKIFITKEFAKRASIKKNPEYKLLLELREENPEYAIDYKAVEISASKNTYNGLTYERMENYIKTQPNNVVLMEEYKKARAYFRNDCRYAKVKKWFLATFENYNDDYPSNITEKSEDNNVPVDSVSEENSNVAEDDRAQNNIA